MRQAARGRRGRVAPIRGEHFVERGAALDTGQLQGPAGVHERLCDRAHRAQSGRNSTRVSVHHYQQHGVQVTYNQQ